MDLRERIKRTRMQYKITQQEVADMLQVNRVYITGIENNSCNVHATEKRLEEVLNAVYKVQAKKLDERGGH